MHNIFKFYYIFLIGFQLFHVGLSNLWDIDLQPTFFLNFSKNKCLQLEFDKMW